MGAMVAFVITPLVILGWWIGLCLVFVGLGLPFRRLFGLQSLDGETFLLAFWMGWTITIGILQIWQLWLRIDERAFFCFLLVGLVGLIGLRNDLWLFIKQSLRPPSVLLVVMVMGVWLANRAIEPMKDVDAGLYYINALQWIIAYPIVPGLGNLHERLAFNNSSFLYDALLNVGSWHWKFQHIATGLLLFVLLAQMLLNMARLLSQKDGYSTRHPYYFYQGLLVPPVLLYVFQNSISTLSPDAVVFILGIVLAGQVLVFLIEKGNFSENDEQRYRLFFIVVLSSVGVSVKFSFLFFGGSSILLVSLVWICVNRSCARQGYIRMLLLSWAGGLFLLIPWVIRNVILSGYLVYPIASLAVPVDWQVPRALTLSILYWIRSWARLPGVHWVSVLPTSDWLQSWLNSVPPFVIQPLQLTLLMLVALGLLQGTATYGTKKSQGLWLFLVPPMMGLIFWFVSAPDPRFAGASFWILAAGLLTLLFERLVRQYHVPDQMVQLARGMLVLIVFLYVAPLKNPLWIMPSLETASGLPPLPEVRYSTAVTDSGLQVYFPLENGLCWDAPLPCTPYVRPGLQLRELGELRAGFRLDRSTEFVDMVVATRTDGVTASPALGIALATGWYDFEPEMNLRWMLSPATILIYTERETDAVLSLTPYLMSLGNRFGATGQLTVTVNREVDQVVPITAGVTSEIALHLQRDFTIVSLELVAGNVVPATVIPGNPDTRTLSVAFFPLDLRIVPQATQGAAE